MRLGPALLVALLPLLAGANITIVPPITSAFVNESSIDRFGYDALTTVPSYNVDSVQTSSTTPRLFLPSTRSHIDGNINGYSYPDHNSEEKDDDSVDDVETIKHITTETLPIIRIIIDNLTAGNLKSEKATNKMENNLTVGYLTAVKGDLKERQGLTVSGALTMALEKINSDVDVLPNVRLNLRWNDTKGDTVLATRAMTDMICDGVAAFFGPEGSCHVEAIVAQSRNIPMISYKCSDYKASTVPTFARTEPPDTQVTKSVLSLLRYYNWKKFAIIYEEGRESVAKSLEAEAKNRSMIINDIQFAGDKHKCCELEAEAKNRSMIINDIQFAGDKHKCCEKELNCCQSVYWYQIIQETKNKTRIYVFLGNVGSLIDLMNTMQTAQLFEKGEYIVIYVDWETYSEKQASKYLWKPDVFDKNSDCKEHNKGFENKAKSLLVIVPTAPTENYEQFLNEVRDYNKKEPFNFSTPNIFEVQNIQKFVPIHAAYLYDSVMLYAKALDKLINDEKTSLAPRSIDEIASNGTEIIKTIIDFKNYSSITGATMKIDQNGDSEGNFSVLAVTRVFADHRIVRTNFSCEFQMRPVAQFQAQTDLPVYQINKNSKVEWPNGNVPSDEPSCGFNNEMCLKNDTHLNSIIVAAVLAVLLFCAGVITMSIYRKWKIEQEIEGLLWKIDRSEIYGYFERDIITSPSRMSLGSASATSYESRGGAQVFASTAQFRGVMVRIQELTFSRKKDISRDIMKEMRLLRELRHDNINSFIGACVEPMSLLLVTDYCAKGSLYDIIENEDIKLDKMFVASLVHDLIKGMLYIHNSMLVCHGNLKSSNCVVTSRSIQC
ncbi:Receptor family ligand binding region [Popillia japonica]|uniref:guanylate cyclase n=1 Tax=Popillia japonica TaxID=7064 RepID=A0AAW1N0B2_POPJA